MGMIEGTITYVTGFKFIRTRKKTLTDVATEALARDLDTRIMAELEKNGETESSNP